MSAPGCLEFAEHWNLDDAYTANDDIHDDTDDVHDDDHGADSAGEPIWLMMMLMMIALIRMMSILLLLLVLAFRAPCSCIM